MEQSHLKVSVIIPFFNAANTLEACLKSISVQTFKDFECVLIDNNSSDGGAEIAKRYCESDERFKLIHEKQQGVAFASNAGSAVAKGKYIARIDADDIAMADRLEKQYTFLGQNRDYGAVAGLSKYGAHKDNTEGFERFVFWCNQQVSYDDIFKRRFIDTTIINPTAMWRKSVEQKIGGYRHGDFPEDYEMWLRWLQAGVKIGKINSEVIQWHDSDGRLTRTDNIYSTEAFFKIKSYYFSLWFKTHKCFPKLLIWGASRVSRKNLDYLGENGVQIKGFIDTKRSRKLKSDIVYYKDLPEVGKAFVLVVMKHADIRKQIGDFLKERNYKEGEHYLYFA